MVLTFFIVRCATDENTPIQSTFIEFDINNTSTLISDIAPISIDPLGMGLSQSVDPNICATASSFINDKFSINGVTELFLWRFTDIQIDKLSCVINSNNYANLIPLGSEFKFLNTANDCFGNSGIAESNTILFNIGNGVSSRSDFGCQPSDSFFEITSVEQLDIDEGGIRPVYPLLMEARFKFVTYMAGNDLPDHKIAGKMRIIINIDA